MDQTHKQPTQGQTNHYITKVVSQKSDNSIYNCFSQVSQSPCLKIGKCAITFNKLSDYLVTLDTGKWNKTSSWI